MAKKVVIEKVPAEVGPQDEGLPAWMATFADMVTLLLCFFVLLLSFAEQDAQKFHDVRGSLQGAFGAQVVRTKSDKLAETTTSSTKDKAAPASDESTVMKGIVFQLKSLMKTDKNFKQAAGVAADHEGAIVHVESAAIFEPGTAKLKKAARPILGKVITLMKEHPVNVVVRGHTDNKPPKSRRYPSNWELSAARAANTVAYLVDVGGISVNRLKAVAYAQTRPIKSNNSAAGRAANQRVEFYFHEPDEDLWKSPKK